jgi:hypothetical protein
MNEQEKQLIEALASRIHNAPAPEIDGEADALIRNGIGIRPDALYILTQTVLVQEMALNRAMAQIEELKKHRAETAPASGSILGSSVASAPGGWPRQQSATASAAPPDPMAPPPPQYAAVPPQAGPQTPAAGSGMFSGFLRSAATTAAGVIAGEAAFSALSGLFGHHSGFGPGGGSGFLGAGSGVSPGSETIINNYYGEQKGDRGSTPTAAGLAGDDAAAGAAPGDAARDADDSYQTATPDDSEESYDDSAQDDSAVDDSSDDSDSYDDGGGPFEV